MDGGTRTFRFEKKKNKKEQERALLKNFCCLSPRDMRYSKSFIFFILYVFGICETSKLDRNMLLIIGKPFLMCDSLRKDFEKKSLLFRILFS